MYFVVSNTVYLAHPTKNLKKAKLVVAFARPIVIGVSSTFGVLLFFISDVFKYKSEPMHHSLLVSSAILYLSFGVLALYMIRVKNRWVRLGMLISVPFEVWQLWKEVLDTQYVNVKYAQHNRATWLEQFEAMRIIVHEWIKFSSFPPVLREAAKQRLEKVATLLAIEQAKEATKSVVRIKRV